MIWISTDWKSSELDRPLICISTEDQICHHNGRRQIGWDPDRFSRHTESLKVCQPEGRAVTDIITLNQSISIQRQSVDWSAHRIASSLQFAVRGWSANWYLQSSISKRTRRIRNFFFPVVRGLQCLSLVLLWANDVCCIFCVSFVQSHYQWCQLPAIFRQKIHGCYKKRSVMIVFSHVEWTLLLPWEMILKALTSNSQSRSIVFT